MTNLYTKVVIIAISVFLVTFTGCKKDEETAPTFTIESTSLDFEWGQTKEIGYTYHRVKSFTAPTVPTGWICTMGGGKIVITAPAEGGTTTGTVGLSAETEAGTTLTRNIIVSVRIAQEIPAMANSLIVSQPNKRFKFNALRRGNETTESITGAVRATRVWTTSASAIVNVSLENGYLYFATGNAATLTEGNAVVAVTDKDGKILWSWHIWATATDPTADPDIVGSFRVMNRNLGAFTNSNATPEDAVRSYGLYYQWGRKDPFVGPLIWNSTIPQYLYNSSSSAMHHTFTVSTAETGNVEYAIANPGTFIAGNADNSYNWLASSNNALWNVSSKTLYDPCPAGWRVAPPEIWAGFTKTGRPSSDLNVEGDYEYGWTFVNGDETIFYPAAGRRSFSPSLAKPEDNLTNVVNDDEGVGYPVGFYWSSAYPIAHTPNGAGQEGSTLSFDRNWVNPAAIVNELVEYAAAGGFPLRCVAE